jgi:hypothetical protein
VNDSLRLRRLRSFLLGLAAVGLLGTVAELLLIGHAEDPVQLSPYLLCGLGFVTLAVVWLRPTPSTVLALRLAMILVALGSLFGVAQHFWANLELGRETQPNADATRLLILALNGGVPLLAPGILAFSALVALAATYAVGEPPKLESADSRQRSP